MWSEGDVIVRREVRNEGWACARGCRSSSCATRANSSRTYLPEGARCHVPAGPRSRIRGRTAAPGRATASLMLQRPGEAHAIWVFWDGPEREFAGWYVNFQEPFRRTGTRLRHAGPRARHLASPRRRRLASGRTSEKLDERVREGGTRRSRSRRSGRGPPRGGGARRGAGAGGTHGGRRSSPIAAWAARRLSLSD